MSSTIVETPRLLTLDALHRSLGARIAPFAGYAMPIQYPSGLKAEHLHTRSQAGLFDVSHMGQLRIRARDGRRETLFGALESALPLDFDGWASGQQRYSLLLNEQGGIEDDLMMLRLDTDAQTSEIRMVVNASNRESDRAWLTARCPSLEIEWVDAALIALQGPQAEAVLATLDPVAASMGVTAGPMSEPCRGRPASSRSVSRAPSPIGCTAGWASSWRAMVSAALSGIEIS